MPPPPAASGPYTALIPPDADPQAPVVCLLGWVGAQDKALLKYAELVARHGYPSVRSVQPMAYLFSPLARPRRQWALQLLEFLLEQRLCPPRRLVLFAFSNGGGSVIEQIQEIAESEKRWAFLRDLTAGFVFDSAPGYFHPYMARRVLHTEMPPGVRRWAWVQGIELARRVEALLSGARPELYWANMLRLGWGRPQLYLYSKDDRLCDVVELEKLIEEKERRGQRVTVMRWEQSAHVTHLKLHPEEYRAALLPFLERLKHEPMVNSKL